MALSSKLVRKLRALLGKTLELELVSAVEAADPDNSPQVASVIWDFAEDGGDEGSIDLTAKVKNLFPVGSLVTHFCIIALEGLTVSGTPQIGVDDGVSPTIFFGTSAATDFSNAGTSLSFPYNPNGNINGDVRIVESDSGPNSTALPNVTFSITGGDLTGGKMQIFLTYLRPAT